MNVIKKIVICISDEDWPDHRHATIEGYANAVLQYEQAHGAPLDVTEHLRPSLIAALSLWYDQHFANKND